MLRTILQPRMRPNGCGVPRRKQTVARSPVLAIVSWRKNHADYFSIITSILAGGAESESLNRLSKAKYKSTGK